MDEKKNPAVSENFHFEVPQGCGGGCGGCGTPDPYTDQAAITDFISDYRGIIKDIDAISDEDVAALSSELDALFGGDDK